MLLIVGNSSYFISSVDPSGNNHNKFAVLLDFAAWCNDTKLTYQKTDNYKFQFQAFLSKKKSKSSKSGPEQTKKSNRSIKSKYHFERSEEFVENDGKMSVRTRCVEQPKGKIWFPHKY
jgi:hypothetical protein